MYIFALQMDHLGYLGCKATGRRRHSRQVLPTPPENEEKEKESK